MWWLKDVMAAKGRGEFHENFMERDSKPLWASPGGRIQMSTLDRGDFMTRMQHAAISKLMGQGACMACRWVLMGADSRIARTRGWGWISCTVSWQAYDGPAVWVILRARVMLPKQIRSIPEVVKDARTTLVRIASLASELMVRFGRSNSSPPRFPPYPLSVSCPFLHVFSL